MIVVLQLIVLAITTVTIALRFSAYRRSASGSSGRHIFHMFLLLEVAVILWIRPVGDALDQLASFPLSSVTLRLIVFTAMSLLAYSMAVSFKYWRAAEVVGGPGGIAFLALCTALIVIAVMLGASQSSIGEPTLGNVLYTVTWRVYGCFIGIVLLLVLMPVMISPVRKWSVRIAAGFILLFAVCSILALGMSIIAYALPSHPSLALYITDGIGVLGVLLGLLIFWASNFVMRWKKTRA